MKQVAKLDALRAFEENFAGKRFCYTASNRGGSFWGLSVVVAGEAGHYPFPTSIHGGSDREMHDLADDINRIHLMLTPPEVTAMVCYSMSSTAEKAGGLIATRGPYRNWGALRTWERSNR